MSKHSRTDDNDFITKIKPEESDAPSVATSTDHPTPAASSTPRRANAYTTTVRDSPDYKMNHKKRGLCLIFCYEEFENPEVKQRDCARSDALACKEAFEALGFEVRRHFNRTTDQYTEILSRANQADHSNHDCLSVVFMSHGNLSEGIQTLNTYDGKVEAESLWKPFRADACNDLAGKPKLFFIQACRGEEPDYGVALQVQTDAIPERGLTDDYVIPWEADILIMWASAPGKMAWRRSPGGDGIQGSVFIHFLTQNLRACATPNQEHFLDIVLLQVTRQVAMEYEVNANDKNWKNKNKQVPQTVSTLLRRVPLHQSL